MNPKGMARLLQITATIRERELAALAGLMAERKKLADKERAVAQAMHEARQAGQEGPTAAHQAEVFARWAARQQDFIDQEVAQLAPIIDAQRRRTAKAVGRHETLGEVDQRLRKDLQQKKDRKHQPDGPLPGEVR